MSRWPFVDVTIDTLPHGNDRLTVTINGVSYTYAFQHPMREALEAIMERFSDGINYDDRTAGRWRTCALQQGLRVWSLVEAAPDLEVAVALHRLGATLPASTQEGLMRRPIFPQKVPIRDVRQERQSSEYKKFIRDRVRPNRGFVA